MYPLFFSISRMGKVWDNRRMTGNSSRDGMIFKIRRFSTFDGPGIRTTVFLKGCPLRCPWCCEPNGQSPERELIYHEDLCAGCESCLSICIIRDSGDGRIQAWIPETCTTCGNCVRACPQGAREIAGNKVSVEGIMKQLLADKDHFIQSGGGVTFSGGEPLLQQPFLRGLLAECRKNGIHTAVDTSGHVPQETVMDISDEADLFLYDVKIMVEQIHREYLGISNDLVLSNLRLLAGQGRDVWLRIPVLPGINDDEENVEGFMSLILELPEIRKICLIPFQAVEQNAFMCPGTLRDEEGHLHGPAESAERIKEKLSSVSDRVIVITPG